MVSRGRKGEHCLLFIHLVINAGIETLQVAAVCAPVRKRQRQHESESTETTRE